MRNARSRLCIGSVLLPVTALSVGCASSAPSHFVYLGPENAQNHAFALAAGDSLGRAIFVNDVILAARMQQGSQSQLADVPIDINPSR